MPLPDAFGALGFGLEKVLLGAVSMPGEDVRIAIAFLGLLVASYYDIFNRRIIPDRLLYLFFLLSVVVNAVFFDPSLVLYTLVAGVFVFLFSYLLYFLGQLGGADVLVMVSLTLLLPIHPSFVSVQPNYPLILSIFVFSFTLFTLYTLVHLGPRLLQKHAAADWRYALLFLPYGAVLYLLFSTPFIVPISSVYLFILSVAIIGSVFYLVYKKPILRLLSQNLPLRKVEDGDILVLEFMDPKIVWKYKLQRLVDRAELERLQKLRLSAVWVFTGLPPFIPFLLLGLIFALFFSPLLLG